MPNQRSEIKAMLKDKLSTQQIGEILRFGIVGVVAVALQYGVYLLMLRWLRPTLANTVAYVVSVMFNYIASTRFTFRVKSTARRGAGFAFSHVVNYLLPTAVLSLFLLIGFTKQWAMLPTFMVSVPVNFVLVRYFLKKN